MESFELTANTPNVLQPQRKAKGEGHLRRGEILKAAERIFISEGYEAATIRRIADEVGVSSTALYMHFADKDAIIVEICLASVTILVETINDTAALEIDPISRLRLILRGYIDFGLKNPATYQLVFGMPQRASRETQAKILKIGIDCFKTFSKVIKELEIENCLRVSDHAAVNQAVWAACHGLVTMLISFPGFPWAPQEQLVKVMIDAVLVGLIAGPISDDGLDKPPT